MTRIPLSRPCAQTAWPVAAFNAMSKRDGAACTPACGRTERQSLAYPNLLCAIGLRDSRALDISACLRALAVWTRLVECETDRHFYRYRQRPQEFNGSEGYFRILMMITVLQQDCGVRYDMDCSKTSVFR